MPGRGGRKRKGRTFYFVVCFLVVCFLGSIRSAPVWGKLDFILLDSRPWWPAWKPMVVKVLGQGDRPVYTDPMTSAVLKGVFGQKTVFARRFSLFPVFNIEEMDRLNRPAWPRVPLGAYVTLLGRGHPGQPDAGRPGWSDWGTFIGNFSRESLYRGRDPARPYRCVVNLHGFTATWVPWRTRHWNANLADTRLFYRYYQNGAEDLVPRVRRELPENCEVFF